MKSDSQNNEYTHSEIRELLDKWFEASISAEEENRLRMLIDSDVDLPDDIEDDCILFSSLTSVSFEDLQDSDIPTDADSRITEAVEAEIKKSRLLQLPVALLKNLLLTSSTCHPKLIGEQRCDALMTFHQHRFSQHFIDLGKFDLYCDDGLCKSQYLVDAHSYF